MKTNHTWVPCCDRVEFSQGVCLYKLEDVCQTLLVDVRRQIGLRGILNWQYVVLLRDLCTIGIYL